MLGVQFCSQVGLEGQEILRQLHLSHEIFAEARHSLLVKGRSFVQFLLCRR